MNTPNKLTLLRILAIPACIFFLMMKKIPHNELWALILFAAASITDFIDGRLARKNQSGDRFWQVFRPPCRQNAGLLRIDLLHRAGRRTSSSHCLHYIP